MKIINTNNIENKILDSQDKELDKLQKSVKHILYLSTEIYNEIEEQNNYIIPPLDNNIDRTIPKINNVEKRTDKLVKEDCSICIIL
jgi:hypothetical protein